MSEYKSRNDLLNNFIQYLQSVEDYEIKQAKQEIVKRIKDNAYSLSASGLREYIDNLEKELE